jgi:hypothetical protein
MKDIANKTVFQCYWFVLPETYVYNDCFSKYFFNLLYFMFWGKEYVDQNCKAKNMMYIDILTELLFQG